MLMFCPVSSASSYIAFALHSSGTPMHSECPLASNVKEPVELEIPA